MEHLKRLVFCGAIAFRVQLIVSHRGFVRAGPDVAMEKKTSPAGTREDLYE
jgi:hypothetical protein